MAFHEKAATVIATAFLPLPAYTDRAWHLHFRHYHGESIADTGCNNEALLLASSISAVIFSTPAIWAAAVSSDADIDFAMSSSSLNDN